MVSNALLFGLFVFASIGGFVDTRTTEVGLSNGFVEANPIGKFLISKLTISGAYALKAAILPIGFTWLTALVSPYFMIPQIALGAVSLGVGIRNYLLLKSKKIAVF